MIEETHLHTLFMKEFLQILNVILLHNIKRQLIRCIDIRLLILEEVVIPDVCSTTRILVSKVDVGVKLKYHSVVWVYFVN